jgi:calcineurin-like phosphoesterase family protein
MTYFFTSDLHLGHANIIKYCNRPFSTLEEMNNKIISNWNARVKKEDVVFHVGDFCFKNTKNNIPKGEGDAQREVEYEKQLNGKIIFIQGNHDKNSQCKTPIESITISLGGRTLRLVHKPDHVNFAYDLHLTGHVHEKWQCQRFTSNVVAGITDCVNVGVDVWNFYPVTINEILARYNRWKKQEKLI